MKIAIVTRQMVMGGIEKSLIQLCRKLIEAGIEVTLYLEVLGGALFQDLPREVNIVHIFEHQESMPQIIMDALRHGRFGTAVRAVRAGMIYRTSDDPVLGWEATASYLSRSDIEYDYAFAYGAPISFSVIYVDHVLRAKKKYVWVHNNPFGLSLSIIRYKKIFQRFEKIICVSRSTQKNMEKCLPEYQDKMITFYNNIDANEILILGEQSIDIKCFDGMKLLTVGRLCKDKGQDIIPPIAKRLKENGHSFKWYCVGDGEEQDNLKKEISNYGVSENMILVGSQNNPYPYFKMADVYVQPSRYEGFGITIAEAKLFQLPIIATNFQGAEEQLQPGVTGIIVNFDENEIFQAVNAMLSDPNSRKRLRENLRHDPKKCVSSISEIIQLEDK